MYDAGVTQGRLPDFLILGTAKAGTTALFGALSRHTRVFCSPEKEPRFFAYAGCQPLFNGPGGAENARAVRSSEKAYTALFDKCPAGSIAGEASTAYLSSDTAPAAAFHYVPHARLIAILRHPVERAYSQYLHLRREGAEPLGDFEDAWNAQDARIDQGWRPTTHYRNRGFYGAALTRWLSVFPREQLLILFYEDWRSRPEQVLGLVSAHLRIEPFEDPVVREENVSSLQPRWPWLHHRMVEDNALRRWTKRRLPLTVRDVITRSVSGVNLRPGRRLDPAVRARLSAIYHDDLKVVESLTGRDLSAWRR